LKSKLVDNILKHKKLNEEKVKQPSLKMADGKDNIKYEKELEEWKKYLEYRQSERRALNHLSIKLVDVIANIKHAKNLLSFDYDPDFRKIRKEKPAEKQEQEE